MKNLLLAWYKPVLKCLYRIATTIWRSKTLKIMKLVTIVILAITVHLSATDADAQLVTLHEQNTELSRVLLKIRKQTSYNFLFNNQVLNKARPVTVKFNRIPLIKALNALFEEQPLSYSIIDQTIVIKEAPEKTTYKNFHPIAPLEEYVFIDDPADLLAVIRGTVSDESGNPLIGVNIQVKGTTRGTTTDFDGGYNIDADLQDTLVFTYIGYKSVEVPVRGRTEINITLLEDVAELEELVVVGYGTMKKSDLTGSVTSVQAGDIEDQGPKTNIFETLQGLTPGLDISFSSNSAAQESVGLMIRGQNSIAASNTPLIVLDGVPYNGDLNQINQNDIQSVEVLKDASSIAIYGARGSNGVILITTKKGKQGKPKISYSGSWGMKEIYNLPPLMNGQQHWGFAVERYSEEVVASYPTRLENYQKGNSTDWVGLVTRTGKNMKHNLKLDGGGENFTYFLSGTYNDVKGIAVGDDFEQYILRSNLSFDVTNWLSIGTNTQYSNQDLSGLNANFNQAFYLIPLINAYDDEGMIDLYPWPEEPLFQNPLSNLNVKDEHFKRSLFSNTYLSVDFPFLSGLSYKLNTGYTFSGVEIGRFWGNNTVVGLENQGQAYTENTTMRDRLVENIVTYRKNWGIHALDFTALYSIQNFQNEGRYLTSKNFPTPVLTWYQNDVAGVLNPSSSYVEQKYLSQMGRINYNYNSKYLMTVTVRRDGYSGFGENNKFGVFPSIAAGWNINKEPFMSDYNNIDQLKLRVSYGRNGNQAINPYQTMANLNQSSYLTGPAGIETAPGYYPGSLSSPSLGWETSKSLNIGLDFGFMNGRFTGALDYYNTNTYDLLLNRSISPVHGINSIIQNIGQTENNGIEFLFSSVNIQKNGFRWETNFNFAHSKNEIVDLYGNQKDDVANGWFIGRSINVNFGYVYDGVWQRNDENSAQPDAIPGDIKVKDVNQDGEIDPDDRDFLGQTNPKFTIGLTNSLLYKNFMFSFILYTEQGVTRVNPLWDTDKVWSDVRRNSIVLNYWSEENPTNEYPANRDGTNPNEVRFYQDASFIRLRDVTLSYSFKGTTLEKIGLNETRLFFNIRNALTFTDWYGLDPELSNQRGIPLDRSYSVGLNVSF